MVALLYIAATGDSASSMYQIVVGVSLVTTCFNPFMLRMSDPVGDFVERKVPDRVKGLIAQYNVWLARIREASVPGEISSRVHRHLLHLGVYWVMMFAFSVIASMLNGYDWSRFSMFFDEHKKAFFALALNLIFLALLKPVWTAGRHLGEDVGDLLLAGVKSGGGKKWRRAVRRMARSSTLLAVSFVTVAEIVMVDINLMPEETCVRIGIAIVLAVTIPLAVRYLWPAVSAAGMQFNEALEAEARMAAKPKPLTFSLPEDRFLKATLPDSSPAIGLTLKALDVRAKTGASVVSVTRNGRRHSNPGADWCFEIGDIVEAIGEPKELASLKDLLGIVVSVHSDDEF